ncbi:hypothetical protein DCAR_0933498 [Daucus carota subsp. sativus]|uniref:Uncharacterized protein n=1 Tax=Daucus carota subsp. sativus TaxID=79200 RepID=A0A175YD38_DAUCS|nr:hypothetical protein DCAR_0933498 [Daucus carota subsp. sativus]
MKGNKTSDLNKGYARKHGDSEQRPVLLWSKNWIIGRWIALCFLIFFLLVVDVHCFYLLRKYNPEDTVYGLLVMIFGNLVGFGFLGTQARELIEDSNTVNDLPWWCYGLTSSTSD